MWLFGLTEHFGNKIKLRECVKQFLSEALGEELGESEMEMVHRFLTKVPSEGALSRSVIIHFHSFLKQYSADAVRMKAGECGGIQWDGSKLSLFADMTKDVLERRKKSTMSGRSCMIWMFASHWHFLPYCSLRRRERM